MDSFTYLQSDGHRGNVQSTLSIAIIPSGAHYVSGVPSTNTVAGNGNAIIDASLGNQIVIAGNGADIIVGGPRDVLTGGNGPDTFAFGTPSGQNTITDFEAHNDPVQFDRTLFAKFGAIIDHGHQIGADVVIAYHGADTPTLQHTTLALLHASDFCCCKSRKVKFELG